MYEISLNALGIIIGLATGVIGMTTGVISLVWLIRTNRVKLKVGSVYFVKGGFSAYGARGHEEIGVRIILKNIGNRSTTIGYFANNWKSPPRSTFF